ncbi:MAG: hypothetical protein IJV35_01580 [Neisseriaceae bacterium]|nr:hypothetical protein [Neisseriaceae bacterium]
MNQKRSLGKRILRIVLSTLSISVLVGVFWVLCKTCLWAINPNIVSGFIPTDKTDVGETLVVGFLWTLLPALIFSVILDLIVDKTSKISLIIYAVISGLFFATVGEVLIHWIYTGNFFHTPNQWIRKINHWQDWIVILSDRTLILPCIFAALITTITLKSIGKK